MIHSGRQSSPAILHSRHAPPERPLRVTFVLPFAGLSGGIRVLAMHAERLRRLGHSVTAVSCPALTPTMRERARAVVRRRSLPIRPPTASFFDGLPIEHRVLDRYRPVVDADVPDADVVIATWWETAEWVAALSPSKGAKVLFIQGFEVRGNPDDARLEATWWLPMHKVVVSSWLADLARDRFHDPNVSLVANSVDMSLFTAPERDKQHDPTVGFVYSAEPCKGPDILVQALRLAAESIPGLRMVGFGLDPIEAAQGLPAGVRYERAPRQSRLPEIYASCDAWIFSSRAEGFGLPVLEAMACRTPVIATPAGASRELLSGGGGFLVGCEDAAGIAARIADVASMDNESWRRLSQCAHRTAHGWSWDQAGRQFEAALLVAIERARRAEIEGGFKNA